MTDIQSQLEQLKAEDYQQDQTRLCTMMAFLIGVDWLKCSFYYEQDKALYEELKANKACVIIRSLCRIRTNLILNFSETENEIRYNLCNIDRQERFREDVKTLHKNDVDIIKVNYHVNQYLADLNKLIAQRINDVKGIFPDWVRWDYIRPLFIMPKGQNEKDISARSKEYLANKNCYPYQMYINWIPVEEGNILINDRKFVKVLYSQHGDVFTDMSKVKDASETVKKNIYEFIDDNETIQLVVDCENSDPFKLASVLKQLDKDSLQKIQKIVLYDDVHTTNAWRYLKAVTGIPVEHNVVERIKYDKSLVDIKIAMGISKAYYKDNVTAFILLSSDSDFWGVISSLPDAEFLVMVEEGKCGPDIQSTLENDGTYYCFMDDFCTGNIKSFKNAMFVSALKEEVECMISLDTKELCDSIVRNLRMDISSTEKSNYYSKYIRRLRLEIDDDGIMRIRVQEE